MFMYGKYSKYFQVRIDNPEGKKFLKSGMIVRVPSEYMKILQLKRKFGKDKK